ncbi:hypothetical protein FRC17_007599, partial [Serendipita sp. 399]
MSDIKREVQHVDSAGSSGHDRDKDQRLDLEFGGAEARARLERKLLWKLDLRMSILVAIIDRNNAAAARLRGFEAGKYSSDVAYRLDNDRIMKISISMASNLPLYCRSYRIGKPSIYLP